MSYTNSKLLDRALAIVLTVMMVLTLVPLNVFAFENTQYATVTTLTGGIVNNNGTDNTEVVIDETTLNWVAKNADRAYDGWWVGMKVTAPEGYTNAQLQNATYTKRTTALGGTAWSDATTVNFWSAKDSKDEADKHYVEFWMYVSPALLNSYKTNGKNIQTEVVFDWNNDNINDQTVVLSVVPSEQIVLKQDGEQVYPVITYDVTVEKNEGGIVKVNDAENATTTVDRNSDVSFSVEANDGYQISTIKVDGVEQDIPAGATEYDDKILSIKKDSKIEVVFVKVYTATIKHDGTGTGVSNPANGGSVTVKSGNTIDITATPDEGNRVGSVTINGEQDTSVSGANNSAYSATITADKDYEVVITFVPNVYKIEVAASENGTVTSANAAVEHGEDTVVNLSPAQGYTVDTVMVNGTSVDAIVKDDTGVYFSIENITADQNIVVTYKKISTASKSDFTIDSSAALRNNDENTLFVMKDGSSIIFKTDKAGIKVYNADGIIGGSETTQSVVITPDTVVTKVELYYKADTEYYDEWHEVVMDDVKIVVDTGNITASLVPTSVANENGYYNSNVNFTVNAEDTGDYSGLALVEYWITLNGVDGETVTLYEYKDGKEKAVFTNSIVVDAKLYNSDDVKVNLHVVDRAGNEKFVEQKLKINSTRPTISLDITGTKSDNAKDGYYSDKRELTITIVDREDTFSKANVAFALLIKKNGQAVVVNTNDITWTDNDSLHIGKYTFDAEGHYEWSISYKNLADLENDGVTAPSDKFIYDFCIDKAAPYELEITYEPSFIDIILENITFGFYKADVKVIVTAYDETAGVDHFTYSYVVDYSNDKPGHEYEVGHKDDAGKENVVIPNNEITFTPDGKKATASFKIPGQFRGYVSFTATDKSGNTSELFADDKCIVVDSEIPIVKVEYDNHNGVNVDNKYYSTGRTATISISADNFFEDYLYCPIDNVDENENYLIITVGKRLENETTFTYTDVQPAFTKNGDYYEATVEFDESAEYTFDIKYTDKSHNVYDIYEQDRFTVDKIAPNASIQIGMWSESVNGTVWDHFPVDDPATQDVNEDTRSFGPLSTNQTVTVTVKSNDTLSYVKTAKYFKSNKIMTLDEVKAHTEWTEGTANSFTFDVSPDEQFIVYAYIIDAVGNEYYVSSDGVILDLTIPTVEKIAPEIIIEPETEKQPINDIYNTNVDVDITVIDPIVKGTCSGLKSVTYNIYNVNSKGEKVYTQPGVLFTFDKEKDGTPISEYSEEKCITIDKTKFNSNEVIIEVVAVDNAGNPETARKTIMIDNTAPVIDIAYDNNEVDNDTYFDAIRKATIKISERNFKNEDVIITVTHTDDNGKQTKTTVTPNFTVEKDGDAPKVYVFDGEGRDGSEYYVYTMDYIYDKDGDYKFEIEYTDLAGNKCTEKNFAEDTAAGTEYEFTIDMSKPIIKVTYDNNDALNGNYYKADRVATIVITEHNLDPNGADKERINITVKATDNGNEITAPVETKWTTSGNTHTATITYSADALYSFDISVKDKAGNDSAEYAEETFYVDKTNPAVSITEIVDQSANNDEGDIGFVITATDTNFDSFAPVLTVTDITGESKKVEVGTISDITNGKVFTVKNIDADGIYRITCTVVDKAGNAFSEVTLQREDGSTYVENRDGNDTLVTFSVNRDGSTYEINADTAALIKQYYVQNVTKNVVIVETNADPLTEYKVTLNGKELTINSDYTVTEEGGNGSWMKYTYSINKDLFDSEGEYKIVVSSKDKANNDAFSDVKDATINFVVDRTAPIVSITGLADNGRYQTDVQTVTIIPTDDGGALKSLIVRTVDEYGKQLKEILNLTGEELEEALAADDGKISFKIKQGLYQNVQIICDDCAVDEDGKTNVYDVTIKNVSVDTNAFIVNFWANKPLRWGSIAGVILLAAAIILFVLFMKRKKEN